MECSRTNITELTDVDREIEIVDDIIKTATEQSILTVCSN